MTDATLGYPLLLMPKVKGQTKISTKNQVTLPVGFCGTRECGPVTC
jgi:hypothetical protein